MIRTYGSLFTGIGGFDLPARERGYNIMFQVEQNEFCLGRLETHFPRAARFKDVKSFKASPYQGKIDLLTSGFPCQPFSNLGKQLAHHDERSLWDYNFGIVKTIKPRYFIAENVRNIVNTKVFEQVCSDLEKAGYQVWPFVYPTGATDGYDIRYRTIFLAYLSSLGISEGKLQALIANKAPLQPIEERQPFSISIDRSNNVILQGLSKSDLIREIDGFPNWMDRMKALGNAVHVPFVNRLYDIIELLESSIDMNTKPLIVNPAKKEKKHSNKYGYIGTDCWDRQRNERKINRLLEKIAEMPKEERNVLVKAIKQLA
ncbi:DNA cytosine methyltransferase [Methylotenera sp.]|uniref:DNA cytosine methyltransferase n=1 Tax=Methylotenera sp. TaxID=2051956 RepID=UPI002EDBB1EE